MEEQLPDRIEERAKHFQENFKRLQDEIGKVFVGNPTIVQAVLTCLFGDGHALLEGVPGLGKTLLVRTIAQAVDLPFSRIQFTPDLMPADISGTNILVDGAVGGKQFQFQPGPVFANIVLADEINRATPKTQSAMLEAMQEHSVTVAGQKHLLKAPFFVLATQNPIEMDGTYPLPEAQLDRFMFKLLVPSPTFDDLASILDRTTGAAVGEAKNVIGSAAILEMRKLAREILVASHVKAFAVNLVLGTHANSENTTDGIRRFVRCGSSPRGAQALVIASKIRALLDGRYNVATEDIQAVAKDALRHRILLNFEGEAEGITTDTLIEGLLEQLANTSRPLINV